ncbi:zinc-finger domain-containing protein [Aspergillus carlsbadensis]|nr:zinc-finger domain-containing protein [Aspergillus carlsbadensis]
MLLPIARSRVAALSSTWAPRVASQSRTVAAAYSTTVPRFSENNIQANDPTPRTPKPNVSETNATPVDSMGAWDAALQESTDVGERVRTMQAPNRAATWAASQRSREEAMSGPRFEQTIMHVQPTPMAAIELIHKQPVRWTNKKVVSCDGGGGPLGHPRIYINTDKPEIVPCGYCGLPFAHEHHRAYLQSLPETSYPLEATGDAAEVNETQRVTEGGFEQR